MEHEYIYNCREVEHEIPKYFLKPSIKC